MTTVTLRPNGTVVSGTLTGAASAHVATNDDSDASYVVPLASSGPVRCNCGTFTLPALAVTKTIQTQVRCRTVSGSDTLSLTYTLVGGVSVSHLGGSAITTTITTKSAPAVARTLTQAEIDGIQVQAFSSGLGENVRVVEMYVVIVYATAPTCTVSLPTGISTNTSTPLVEWAHTPGSDGGNQTRYQIKIFDAATYGGGGFSADTSTPDWDSGVVVSSATNSNVGVGLDDNTTYRAYVRTAQTINGSPHWSAWAFSGFSIDLTSPPGITSVSPVATSASGLITVTVARNTGTTLWTWVTVERSQDSGTTWEFVRNATVATASGNSFVIVDYEAPNGVSVIYRAQALVDAGGELGVIAGDRVTSSSTSWSSTTDTWLKSPATPALNAKVFTVDRPVMSRTRRQGVFPVLNRDTPVVVSDVLGARTGDVTFISSTAAEADDVLDLVGESVLLLQYPTAADFTELWFAPGEVSETFLTQVLAAVHRHWQVRVTEIDRPLDTSGS